MKKLLVDMDEQELRALMNTLAHAIELVAQDMGVEKLLFTLLIYNDPALCQYVSNAERSSVITSLKECADRLEQNQDITR